MAKVKRWRAGAGQGILQTHEAKKRIAMQIHRHTHTHTHGDAQRSRQTATNTRKTFCCCLPCEFRFGFLIFVVEFGIWVLVNAYEHTLTLTL